ncbi:MAG TPA: hypothetical protein VLA58_05600 [Chitinophagaceae bacterium]|nr:hypothetical protein [Chitinophagaceae bacterium]
MIYHILNGDSLAYSFSDAKIEGEIIVVREGLIEGDLTGNDLNGFWHSRAKIMGLDDTEYHNKVASEFERMLKAPDESEFNLWFEYDLFCQVNMWFVISIINGMSINRKVYAVYTSYLDRSNKHFWNGFGPANSVQLQECFTNRILLDHDHLQLGHELWTSYKSNQFEELIRLAGNESFAYPYLDEVVQAHIDRFPPDGADGRPEKVIEDIVKNVSTDFHRVLEEFWNRESIYGFGDTQLKHLYDKVMRKM